MKHHKRYWLGFVIAFIVNASLIYLTKSSFLDIDQTRPYVKYLSFGMICLSPFTLFSLMLSKGYVWFGVKQYNDKRYHDATAGGPLSYLYVDEIINK